jgi:hypoxanthine phosphoribosyltransferase
MAGQPKVLLSSEQIARRVGELAAEIERDYEGKSPILLCVLKGSFIFCADLARAIRLPLTIEFLGVQSYGDLTVSSGVVQITQDLTRPIRHEHVIVVEDIVDTGLTSAYLLEQLAARRPASLRLCALLRKPSRLKEPVEISYLGFDVGDEFVVGYGLDAGQEYRNLPDLCAIDEPPGF